MNLHIFKRLQQFYWPYKKYFINSLISLLFVTGITVVYPIVLQVTIDDIVLKDRFDLVPYVALIFFGLMVVKGVATFVHQYLGDLFGVTTVYKIRESLYEKLQTLSFTYYDNSKTGDIMSRLTEDVERFRMFLSVGFAELVRITLLIGFSLAVMFYYSIPLALVTMAAMPFLIVVVLRFDRKVHPVFRQIRKSFGRLNTRVQENISGMHTVKSLSREDYEIERFTKSNDDYRQRYLESASIMSKYFPLMEIIGNICATALLAFGGYLVINGSLALGELVAFFSLVWYILGPLMNLGFVVNSFSQSKASGERIIQILDMDNQINEIPNAREESIEGNVVFDHVTLSYANTDEQALTNISFEAPKGKVIGLIGATGSGKTTITQLIPRFYEPSEGNIYIDGRPVTDYSLHSLRKVVGFVLQEPFLFSMTIRDNIAYGVPEASEEDIVAAAKSAQAHDFIMEMPEGYDTLLGERGMGLSGGQKQRIAIARALCIQPQILIFDDATSAVDMETEHAIQQALKKEMAGRTSFIIAHRISSLKHADEILVLDNGSVVERGTHDELLENKGTYERIYQIQYQDRDVVMGQTERKEGAYET